MPLSPIQMFQNNGSNSIEGLLRAGPEAISNIMNQAIQIGRSMSDKQLAQERDLFAMRQQETNLAQRRAENLEQSNKDALRFGRAAFESDRRYATDVANQEFQKNRMSANDVFNQGIDERQMGLSEKKFDYEKGVDEEERQRIIRAQELFDAKYGEGGEPALPSEVTTKASTAETPEARFSLDLREILGRGDSDPDTMKGRPLPADAAPSASTVLAPGKDGAVVPSSNDLNSIRRERFAIEEDLRNPALTGEARVNAKVRAAELEEMEKSMTAKPDSEKAPSATADERQFKTMVLDTKTFPDQRTVLEKGGAKPGDPRYAQAEAYEKDKFENELKSALNYDEDKYAALGGNPEERRRFWQYAQRRAGKAGGSTTSPPSDSPWNVPELR